MISHGVTIQMKATEQYFAMLLFIMPQKAVLTFDSLEILWCDHSNISSLVEFWAWYY